MCIWTHRRRCWISLWVRTNCSSTCRRCESICFWVKETLSVCLWRISSKWLFAWKWFGEKKNLNWDFLLFKKARTWSTGKGFVQLRIVIDIGCGASFDKLPVRRSGDIESLGRTSNEQFRRRYGLGYFLIAVYRSWPVIDHAWTIDGQVFAIVQTFVAHEAFGICSIVENMERSSVQCKGKPELRQSFRWNNSNLNFL